VGIAEDSSIEYIDRAINYLKKSIGFDKKSAYAAEAHALLSMTYGQKIRLNPKKSMILGIRSRRSIRRAKKLNSDNPRVVLAESISNFNTPSQYGGSQEVGLDGFKRVITLFSSNKDIPSHLPSWGEIEAYTWTGIAYMQSQQYQLAQNAFDNALEINPNYGWVKYNLLPQLEILTSAVRKTNIQ